MGARWEETSRYQEQLVHPRNRNEASVAELAPGRRDEFEEFGRARCEPMEGAWVLVQVQQEATEGFMQGVLCLGLCLTPALCGPKGEEVERQGRTRRSLGGWAGPAWNPGGGEKEGVALGHISQTGEPGLALARMPPRPAPPKPRRAQQRR